MSKRFEKYLPFCLLELRISWYFSGGNAGDMEPSVSVLESKRNELFLRSTTKLKPSDHIALIVVLFLLSWEIDASCDLVHIEWKKADCL